jgi:glycosyltransferase involved in cell wall biosynthesis
MSNDLKVALVHDYLSEFGGAERVLLALSEIWPEAPIHTAFYSRGSAWERFSNKDVRVSWFHFLPFASRLASPLRFLAFLVWNSFDFSDYDVVISSANWYITKGLKRSSRTIEICYCHTPPRYLYGFRTSVEWRKYWLVRVYGEIVGHFLRMVDYRAAQRVDFFVANSENVARRIKKFYRREATVIFPPVQIKKQVTSNSPSPMATEGHSKRQEKGEYYLVASRIVGGKGLELAIEAANRLKCPLKVVGRPSGWGAAGKRLRKLAGGSVEFLGEVSDEELAKLYAGAKAFLATAEDEDFGMTPVEAMAAGTPVVAFRGGGYLESVVSGRTGVFFGDYSVESLVSAVKRLDRISISPQACREQAERFSKERFKKEMESFVEKCVNSARS